MKNGKTVNRRRFVAGAIGTTAAAATMGTTFAAPAFLRRQGATTLEVWGGVPAENGPGDLVAAFQEAHPDITVNYTRYVNDDTGNTQLDTALQGGTPIDVYFTYDVPRLAQRIQGGAAVDLTPFIEDDSEIAQWIDSAEGIFHFEDTVYSLPTTREPSFVFMNQEMLEAAEVSPSEDWAVPAFRELAQALSSDTVYGTFAPPDTARQTLGPNYWYAEDGTESNFDHPAFRDYLELHRSMIEEGSAFPWVDVLAQDLRAYAQAPFLIEQNATWITSSFSLRYVNDTEEFPHEFVTSFAPLPKPEGVEDPYNTGSINNWMLMNSTTEKQEAAWTFMQFWLKDGAQHMLKGGKIPAMPGTPEDVVLEGILGPDRDTLYDVESYRNVVFDPDIRLVTDTITTGSAQIAQIYQQVSDRYLIGEIELDEAIEEMKTQADQAIAAATA